MKTFLIRTRRAALTLSCALLILGLAACNSTQQPSEPGLVTEECLVEKVSWDWFNDEPAEVYSDRELFFATPPTDSALIVLQQLCEIYGYDFEVVRARAWEQVLVKINHQGE